MKTAAFRRAIALAVASGVVLSAAPVGWAQTPWVLIARKAAGRIHHMAEEQQQAGRPGYDFASVILEAPSDKVFAVALDHARKNTALRLLMVDPAQRRLQVAEGDRTATLHVVALNDEVSELYVAGTAGPNETLTTSRVVAAIMRVCTEMQKSCSVGN
ncbi:MAG: hypothetical protein ACHQK9_21765 [Reyranellales bacterium]